MLALESKLKSNPDPMMALVREQMRYLLMPIILIGFSFPAVIQVVFSLSVLNGADGLFVTLCYLFWPAWVLFMNQSPESSKWIIFLACSFNVLLYIVLVTGICVSRNMNTFKKIGVWFASYVLGYITSIGVAAVFG